MYKSKNKYSIIMGAYGDDPKHSMFTIHSVIINNKWTIQISYIDTLLILYKWGHFMFFWHHNCAFIYNGQMQQDARFE